MAELTRIPVSAGASCYEVIIGQRMLSPALLPGGASFDKTACVVSRRVYDLHRDYIDAFAAGFPGVRIFLMDDGEENKSFQNAGAFLEDFVAAGLTRSSLVVAVGGGVVGDFAGFLASIYMRGIPFVQVPTTLLAMVDASVGGKVAVNLSRGKNMAGSFHQPLLVLQDIHFLGTLPDSEFKNGLAECLKHGLLGEHGTLEILEENDPASIRNDPNLLRLASRSVSFKASVVEQDERESGVRAILNLGHTAGHAVESLLGYRGISHGEAVALGILVAADVSLSLGYLSEADRGYIGSLVDRYSMLPPALKLDRRDVISHMGYDKKNFMGKIRLVLLKGLGRPVFNHETDPVLLDDALSRYFP